jgi:hypothetical protein
LLVAPVEPPAPKSVPSDAFPEGVDANLTALDLIPGEPLLLAMAPPPVPNPPEPAPKPEPVLPASITPVGLRLLILAGNGVVNNVKQPAAQDITVQVLDESARPVPGAVLAFSLPERGASGLFANGGRTTIVHTGADGLARAVGMIPNRVEGEIPIQVTASYGGRMATATIRQTNFIEPGGVSTGAKVAIVSAIAAGAAVGIIKALENNGSSGLERIRATATVGSPTVGQP